MRKPFFNIGDRIKLKPKQDVVTIREYYAKFHEIINPSANDNFYRHVDKRIDAVFIVENVQFVDKDGCCFYQLSIREESSNFTSTFSHEWILFDEYFDFAENNEVASIFGINDVCLEK